ncbi:MAG: fumarylacetoacetate hydrolase family protein [Pseudomonadota bacterium]
MKLATLSIAGQPRAAAALRDGRWLDISSAGGGYDSLHGIISGGDTALADLRALASKAEAGGHTDGVVDAPKFLSPVPQPRKNVLCVGRNYAEHIAEGDRAQKQNVGVTEHPVFFTKPPTAIVPPDGDILVFPEVSTAIDYEVELAVVIGKPGRNIAQSAAMDHVFGYTILNDITARDVQRRHGGQYFKGKGFDGSCPVGPWIVTADDISDPHNLSIGLSVNGEQRQNGNTADMIFDIPTLIASLSQGMTLEPGDIIATGTPSGVGYAMDPPRFLTAGDTVVCTVSDIGELRNSVRVA